MPAHRLSRAQARVAAAALHEITLELRRQVRYCTDLTATLGRCDLYGARLSADRLERVLEPVTNRTHVAVALEVIHGVLNGGGER